MRVTASLPGLLLLLALLLPGVACGPPRVDAEPAPDLVACPEPRPEVCTHQYDPVCGTRSDGTTKTYGNGCTACADASVVGFRPGACP